MATSSELSLEGGCPCRHVRYRLSAKPLIVHCCHCKCCQRESGSAFIINALFSRDNVTHLDAEPEIIHTPSESGKGQLIARCSRCHGAVWSNYPDAGDVVRFVRVGTLDEPHRFVPDVHIYTSSKVPWVELPDDVPAFLEYYDEDEVWAKEVDERRYAAKLEIRAVKAAEDASSKG